MRTLQTTPEVPRPLRPRRAAGLAAATLSAVVLAIAACGGDSTPKSSAAKSAPGANQPAGGATTPAAPQSFDPAQGLVQDPARLPKTCSGLVTDADIQLALGSPLVGAGNVFTAYQPLPSIKQTGKVKCAYGVVQGSDGKIQSDQIEVQVATYADFAAAQSRGSGTVAGLAAQGAKFQQVSVGGHPATFVTETADSVLVMFDGNRTFLITVNALLLKDDAAQKLALTLGGALLKHIDSTAGPGVTPGSTPTGSATPTGGTEPASPATQGAPAPGATVAPPNPETTPSS